MYVLLDDSLVGGGFPIVMWDGYNQFEIATTRSESDYIVATTSGVHSGDDVSQQGDERIFGALSRHYGISVVNGGYVDFTSTSEVSVSELGQIWLGEGTAPAITALSLDDMPVRRDVPVTVNAVVGSLANVLCLISKANDNTIDIAVCTGFDGEGCFIWDGTQLRFLPDAEVDTSALSAVVADALSESEGRIINVGSVGTDESYTQARPTHYVGAALPIKVFKPTYQSVLDGDVVRGVLRPAVSDITNIILDWSASLGMSELHLMLYKKGDSKIWTYNAIPPSFEESDFIAVECDTDVISANIISYLKNAWGISENIVFDGWREADSYAMLPSIDSVFNYE